MTEASTIISTSNLSRVFDRGSAAVRALDAISLDIARGDYISIMGSSGSGKTTLLNILGLLDTQYEGELMFDQQSARSLGESGATQLRRHHVGFVFQEFHLIPTLTAEENVALPLSASKVKKDEQKKRALQSLALVNLSDKASVYPKHLSAGERQRIAIARALVSNPDIIIADEPTGNLDSSATKDIIEIFLKLNQERNITLVVATHNTDVAESATRKFTMIDGRMRPLQTRNIRQEVTDIFADAEEKNNNAFAQLLNVDVSERGKKIARDNLIALRGMNTLLRALSKQRYSDIQDTYFLDRLHVILQHQFLDAYYWHALLENLLNIIATGNIDAGLAHQYRTITSTQATTHIREKAHRAFYPKIADAVFISSELYRAIIKQDYHIEAHVIYYRTPDGASMAIDVDDLKPQIAKYLTMIEVLIGQYLHYLDQK